MDDNEFIIKYLASGYTSDPIAREIADALTRGAADRLLSLQDELTNYEQRYLDPLTAKPEWLDAIAVWCAWGDVWDKRWAESVKRKLLSDSDFIWANRGNKLVIDYLFQAFGLDAVLAPLDGWILNTTLLSAPLSSDPFSYQVKVSPKYGSNSDEYVLIKKILKNFLPCWIYLEIIYNS